MPAFAFIFGELFNIFVTQTPDEIRKSASIIAAIFVAIALYNLIFSYLSSLLWGLVGEEIGLLLRTRFFHSVLQQEVGFLETDSSTGTLTQVLNADVEILQTVLAAKMTIVYQQGASILGGLIVAFIFSWKLSLVLLSVAPLIAFAAIIQGKLIQLSASRNSAAYQWHWKLSAECESWHRLRGRTTQRRSLSTD